jgi:hypothetical protein
MSFRLDLGRKQWEGSIMFKQAAIFAIAAAIAAVPASAATTVTGGGAVTLTPAGPGAVSSPISFDVSGTGAFTVTFTFTNPFNPAAANGSASFNFDPDLLVFTGGNFSGGGVFAIGGTGTGSSIQVDRLALAGGPQWLTLSGTLNPLATPGGGNNFARIGGSITLTGAAIPEPATWALFILGFGAIGHTMRRRSSKVRVAKASLNFA